MYEFDDTIVAISSSRSDCLRHIVRISGTKAITATADFFEPPISANIKSIVDGEIVVEGMVFMAAVYGFPFGSSYTGEQLLEMHIRSPLCIAEKLMERLCDSKGVRIASAGEFTARAYFNGKLDLAQAEAVAQIIAASNLFQIQAAQRLLKGRLSERLIALRNQTIDLLSLLEAGLDFSEEDITFITESQAIGRVSQITAQLKELIESNIKYERLIGLPTAAIAGCPNAGKSSLLNSLLGVDRSIVSPARATTRDVISEVLEFDYCDAVVSDCAGVIEGDFVDEIDKIAQETAIETAKGADILVFCVDARRKDLTAEKKLFDMVYKGQKLLPLAMKSDTLDKTALENALTKLKDIFGFDFHPINTFNPHETKAVYSQLGNLCYEISGKTAAGQEIIAVNRRHYNSLTKSLQELDDGLKQIRNNSHEIAAIYIRSACEQLAGFDDVKSIDEDILDRIFSEFCIGK